MRFRKFRLNRSFIAPLRVVLIYFIAAGTWILFSDQVLSWLTTDPFWLTRFQTYKGFLFVSITAILLFFQLRSEMRKLEGEVEINLRISENLRNSNELLSAVVTESPLSIITIDHQDLIHLWNPASERTLGWSGGQAMGQALPYVPEGEYDRIHQLRERAFHGETLRDVETRCQTRDGGQIDVILSVAPLHRSGGEIDLIMEIMIDITDRKQAEEKLLQLSASLEQRVKDRTADLEELAIKLSGEIEERKRVEEMLREQTLKLEAINKELESFSYSVSHDLRAPLRQISGYGTLLAEEAGEQLPAQPRSDLDRILAGVAQMNELIDALLVFSRVSRSGLTIEDIDLADLARQVLAGLQEQEPDRQIDVQVPEHILIQGDPRLLRVVMENLLNNAWKFSSKEPKTRIEFGVTCQVDGTRVYFVSDNGAGFDMSQADRLFTAFQRLHHPADFPGLGIGLATVQRVIHRFGGKIWATSEVGKGATFYFTWAGPEEV